MEMKEYTLPKKLDWLNITSETLEKEVIGGPPPLLQKHSFIFQTWDEVIQKIDEITVGYYPDKKYGYFMLFEEQDVCPYETIVDTSYFYNDITTWDKEINFSIFKIPNDESSHQK